LRGHFWKSRTFKFWFLGYIFILLMQMTAGLIYFSGVQQSMTNKTKEMSQMAIDQAANVIDEKLKMIGNIGDSIYVSSEIKRIKFLSLPYDAETYYELHRRASYLGNFSFHADLFHYLYVYYSDMNCLMDAQRLFTEETQIMNALNKNLHIGEEFFTLTAEMNYNRFYMLEDGSLLFLRTLSTRGAGKEPIITLAAAVNTESIREMLAQTGENASGHAWLLSPDGFSINIDNVPCPVGYQEALSAEENGEQALPNEVIVSQPSTKTEMLYVLAIPNDVYMLDVTLTRRWFWGVNIIVLVLGLLFSYYLTMRHYRPVHALKQRVSRGEKAKDDFSLINKRLTELLDEENTMQQEIKRLDNIAGKRALHLLLSNGYSALDARQKDSFRFTGDTFVVAWLCWDEHTADEQRSSTTKADLESVLGMILSHLCEELCEFSILQESGGYVAVFCFPSGTETMDAQLKVCDLCDKLVSQFKNQFPTALDRTYIGDAQVGLKKIQLSYKNALRAKEYADFLPEDGRTFVPFDPLMYTANISWQDYDIMDAERNFVSMMLEGNYVQASKLLHDIMSYYSSTDCMNMYVMRCRMFGVMNMMLNVLHEIEPDILTSPYSNFNPLEALISARSPSELERIVFDIIGHLVGAQEQNTDSKPRVKQIQHFIAANYYDINLSVQMIADTYEISLPYLSRIFKKEYGTGLLDYINRYRVDKAKELMQTSGDESIASIATRVGFGSSQTLIRAFKRYENMTPGQYRQSLN